VGKGQVIIRNGKMPSLQLNRNLMTLVRFAGLGSSSGDPAAFSLISADLNLANEVLTSHNIKIVSDDVDVDGSGNLALAGAGQMNYTGVAKLAARQTGLTDLVANISGATYSNGKLSFPFDLVGTLENPRFMLKSGQGILGGLSKTSPAAGSQGSSPSNLIQGLSNLFGKKKTTAQPPKP
jgi:AsmA-like C-terminal region